MPREHGLRPVLFAIATGPLHVHAIAVQVVATRLQVKRADGHHLRRHIQGKAAVLVVPVLVAPVRDAAAAQVLRIGHHMAERLARRNGPRAVAAAALAEPTSEIELVAAASGEGVSVGEIGCFATNTWHFIRGGAMGVRTNGDAQQHAEPHSSFENTNHQILSR